MTKQYNTPKYRADKRVVAFVSPEVKKAILREAKKKDLSVSSEIGATLAEKYL